MFKCFFCGKTTKNIAGLYLHMHQQHKKHYYNTLERKYVCPICQKRYNTIKGLSRHAFNKYNITLDQRYLFLIILLSNSVHYRKLIKKHMQMYNLLYEQIKSNSFKL